MKSVPKFVSFAIVSVKNPIKFGSTFEKYCLKRGTLDIYSEGDVIFRPEKFKLYYTLEDKIKILIPYCYRHRKYSKLCKLIDANLKEKIKIKLPDHFNIYNDKWDYNWHGVIHDQLDSLLTNFFKVTSMKEFLFSPYYIIINDKKGLPTFTRLANNLGHAYNKNDINNLYYMIGDKLEVNNNEH